MRDDKPVLMSTHGASSAANALKSLAHPIDLTPIGPQLQAAGKPGVVSGYVWAFKSGSNVITNADPLRPGDLCVTTERPAGGDAVQIRRLFPVVAVLFNAPALATALGIAWNGDGWANLVILDEPLVLDPPVPFEAANAEFDIRPGSMFASKFLKPSVDEFLDWLGTQRPQPNATPAPLSYPQNPVTTVSPTGVDTTTKRRLGAVPFRRGVTAAYGTACAACDFDPGFFVAAHLKDWARGGSDEWWNGLPLCPNHHVLFDRGRIGLHPETLTWTALDGATLQALRVSRPDIQHLANKPYPAMLAWKWENPIAGR